MHYLAAGGTEYAVQKFIRHESFDNPAFTNDIALIEVATPIEFSDLVKPIEINQRNVLGNESLFFSECLICYLGIEIWTF